MNVALKQRILGAVVLLALAAIFLPALLNFSDRRAVDRTTQIPPQPDISPIDTPEPVRPEGITPAERDTEIFQVGVDRADQGEDQDPEKSGSNTAGIPKAWLVQVGGFRERDKAQELLNGLLNDGYKAFIRVGPSKSGELHRVFVGPKIEKQRALSDKTAIDKKYHVDSIIVRFEP